MSSTRWYAYPTQAEIDARQKQHQLDLQRLLGLTPRETKPENKPYGLGVLSGVSNRPPSRPYKQHPGTGATGTQTPADKAKTLQSRIDACKSRVTRHINLVNSDTSIPADKKAAMLQKLQAKMLECTTPHGLDKEEKDKGHKDVENIRKGQGQLVRQVTPGALRKNPNVLDSLIKAIWDFFQNIQNRPEPVDRFMAKYPKPVPPVPPAT